MNEYRLSLFPLHIFPFSISKFIAQKFVDVYSEVEGAGIKEHQRLCSLLRRELQLKA